MNEEYLVSNTTRKERQEIVKKALSISLIGQQNPSEYVLDLAKEYIDGKIEIKEIYEKIKERYKR